MEDKSLKSLVIKSIVAAVVAIAALPVSAQEGEQAGLVAVLDVAKVFKAHATFEQQMASIKGEAESLKAQIQKQQEDIRARAQSVAQYEVGSAQRNNLEAKIEQDNAALRTKARQAETDLLNREAQIYYETYTQMQTTVASIAKKYGISLVLRFDSEAIDSTSRPDVIKGVNRPVVYHHKLDLTNLVIRELNPQSANAGGNVRK